MSARVAVCADTFPYPADRGDRIRYRHFLEALRRNYDVVLALVRRRSEAAERPADAVDVTWSRARLAAGVVRALPSGIPVQFGAFADGRARRELAAALGSCDAFVALGARAALYRDAAPPRCARVLDMQDSLTLNARAQWAAPGGLVRRVYGLDNLLKAPRYERGLTRSFAAITVAGPADERWLRERHGISATVVPTPVEIPERVEPPPARPHALFVGDLRFAPNVDAVRNLTGEIWPRVAAANRDARLTVVGHAPGRALARALKASGCATAFSVPEVAPYLAGAALVVAPMRIGSGIKVKVLEAMAAGRAVAMTSLANDGIGAVSGRDAIVTDDPAELAAGIVALLSDPAEAAAMGARGRALVATRFSPATIERALVGVVDGALAGRRR